jgi:hypothetical protein
MQGRWAQWAGAAHPLSSLFPQAAAYGAVARFVFDLGDWENSRWIVFDGASGQLASRRKTHPASSPNPPSTAPAAINHSGFNLLRKTITIVNNVTPTNFRL